MPFPDQRFYKKRRLGPLLAASAEQEHAYGAAHAFLGGTGAVGGAALLQMLSLYEDMFALHRPSPEQVPILLATGHSKEDISVFTRRLFRVAELKYGEGSRPTPVHSGYLTHSGIFVVLDRLRIALLPQLADAEYLRPAEKEQAVATAIEAVRQQIERPDASISSLLAQFVSGARPFSNYLDVYTKAHLATIGGRFLSVTIGIPLPSVVAYHHGALDLIASTTKALTDRELADLKHQFVIALHEDLAQVRNNFTDRLLIAHTTGVGGMYDELVDSAGVRRTAVRLGFAHAAQDEFLAEKHHHANELARLYAESGLLVLITAAAIGIDEVKIDDRIPLHQKIVRQIYDLDRDIFPGSRSAMKPQSPRVLSAGRPLAARQWVRVYPPATITLLSPPRSEDLTFETGTDLRPRFAIRSGENGIFSIANAESLYRTMRVASASELGILLATVGLFGDDPLAPWFIDNICYYNETDNSRQVFDFLRLPQLLECQISGLEPMALQNLGSSKHQGELHCLALFILLHRLRTLDVDAVDPYVDPAQFDPSRFFIEHSRPLTFEDIEAWDVCATSRELTMLVSAKDWTQLLNLKPAPSRRGLFPQRDAVVQKLYQKILTAVWTITSLGTPVVFSNDSEVVASVGYFVAPLDLMVSNSATMYEYFYSRYDKVKQNSSLNEFINFHLCDRGFIDLRPHAIVSVARSPEEPLKGKVCIAHNEDELGHLLANVPSYSYFSTCGLLATLYRLRALYKSLREAVVELGTYPDFRWQMPRDDRGHILVIPGVCEAFRMISEGVEKGTGLERLDGVWGYGRESNLERRREILGFDSE
jgi:hypothetical protein